MRLSSVIAGLSAAAVAFQGIAYAVQGPAKSLLRPPGAQGEADFSARCIKCGKCMEACPYVALFPAPGNQGLAVIDEDLCIAFQGMRCEVCYRTCPLIDQAISIDYRLREGDAIHSVFAPVIDEEQCVGCGLCVERCVVDEPDVAIRIRTDAEHPRAGA